MRFEELWEIVWEQINLPSGAKILLPESLSEMTKQKLLETKMSPKEIAKMIEKAVDDINHGSVENIDHLIEKAVK